MARNSGRRVSLTEQHGPVGPVVNGQLGESNISPRSLGVGDPHRQEISKRRSARAVYAKKPLVGASGSEFLVPHDLGEIATRIGLAEQGPRDQTGILSVRASRPETWTHSTVRVIVEVSGGGALDGRYAILEISGR